MYNFLLIMYPPGAAGKFLSSLLMSSPDIAHFDPLVEKTKNNLQCLNYIKKHFTPDLRHWIRNEPNHADAWNLHFISSKYSRGDNLSCEEFSLLCSEHSTKHFKKSITENKLILFPWHKLTIPSFFNSAKKIIITVDEDSFDWFDNAYWKKHYAVENNKVKYLEHDSTLNPKMKKYFEMYNNDLYSTVPVEKFYKENIEDNINKKIFNKSNKKILHLEESNDLFILELSEILCVNTLIEKMQELSEFLHVSPLDPNFIKEAHSLWIQCHNFDNTDKINNKQ